jgi:hypothetical protein
MSRHSRPSEPYEPGEVTSLGAAPKLVAWMDPDRDGAATLKLFARIGGPTITDLTVRAEINVRERPDRSLRVTLAPTQVPGEFVAELAKTAPELQPTPSVELAPPTALKFVVTATGRDGSTPFTRRVAGDFLVSDPGARLDEQSARVAQVGGDLVLAIVVDVRRAGTYWAMAELFGGPDGDRPVAFARQRLPRLEPGRHRIELLFGGRIIRDGRVDGPYRVVNVRLAQPDTIPPHFAPFVRALPPTPPWKADQFGAGA